MWGVIVDDELSRVLLRLVVISCMGWFLSLLWKGFLSLLWNGFLSLLKG